MNTKDILEFSGEYRWLSNFYPCVVELDGVQYPSTENAYQAAKTLIIRERKDFPNVSAAHSKKMGKLVTKRKDWDSVKLSVMRDLLWQKFTQDRFKELLLKTGNTKIIEGNTWGDVYWGVCDGKGKNHLGVSIMKIRTALQTGLSF